MNVNEFSSAFDTIVNSYASTLEFGNTGNQLNFDEYEKSLYLTKAEYEIVKALYDGSLSTFERDEASRRYLDSLVQQQDYAEEDTESTRLEDKFIHSIFKLPSNLWYIVYEQVHQYSDSSCLASIVSDVVPVQHDDYVRISRNPFRGPTIKRVLRLDKGEHEVELVSINDINDYTLRYLRKPNPIVLEDFNQEQSVEGVSTTTECELPESIHQNILETAVKMALQDRNIINSK